MRDEIFELNLIGDTVMAENVKTYLTDNLVNNLMELGEVLGYTTTKPQDDCSVDRLTYTYFGRVLTLELTISDVPFITTAMIQGLPMDGTRPWYIVDIQSSAMDSLGPIIQEEDVTAPESVEVVTLILTLVQSLLRNVITYDRAEGILTAIHGTEALPILKAQYAMSLDHIARLDKSTVTLGRDV